jgi:phage gp45-like
MRDDAAQGVFDARAMIQLAEVQSINDTGQAQTATVTTSSGATYADVEVVQMYGSASVVPADGAVAMLFAVGGDPANLRAIVYNPSVRMGKLAEGEQAIFTPDGTRVHAAAGGIVNIVAGNQINMNAPAIAMTAKNSITMNTKTLTMNASQEIDITSPITTIHGRLTVTEQATFQADVDISADLTVAGNVAISAGNLTLAGNETITGGTLTVDGRQIAP